MQFVLRPILQNHPAVIGSLMSETFVLYRVTPNRECERGSDRIFFRDFACKGVLALGGKGSPLG